MPGYFNAEDLQTVRERSRIDEVIGAVLTLRPGGGGALVGLCPFHDEKTPSFRVTPARGFYYCFGCGEGGDVIRFVERNQNVSFVEAVEYLAARIGLAMRYTDSEGRSEPGLRIRVLEANRLAEEFFTKALAGPEAIVGRQFLASRGFDQQAAAQFGIGYAPRDGHALRDFLRKSEVTDETMVKAGLIRENGWDFFQGRLLWPIRDAGRSTLGFGARKLSDDDRFPAKYLNTPETAVYKKSNVLYGLDLARANIAKKNQAVIVEGYTDVMAAHLAGVDTAVASCGTAFGEDHAHLLQRLLGSTDVHAGEVVFTFDGDAAGQAAALKVFRLESSFTTQTYVAVEPSGLDPCDLRIREGDAALRELVGRRVPLYRFVMANVISGFDLDRVDGRLQALRAAAPLMTSIRDASLVEGYLRELAQMVGMDINEVRREVGDQRKRRRNAPAPEPTPDAPALVEVSTLPVPNARDPRLEPQRGTLRLMLRAPELFSADWNQLAAAHFSHPAYRAVMETILAADPESRKSTDWPHLLITEDTDTLVGRLIAELSVEPLLRDPSPEYAAEYTTQLLLVELSRQIDQLKSRLQRTNPVNDKPTYDQMFQQLVSLEAKRKQLRARIS
ncbi:MAG: DNA primase [Propionibacteriaceae bacterium]|jgi:DNA primase|nr:DNA primase [Propionibacteriaceae bacterium]